MVQNNKVLTVSYGTFSCTLEGFDDSFETMKSIAEYFRDLAADDRYFGSEPPQPDAEMLTRIAQRDGTQRVEASQSDSGLLLRATDEPKAAAQPEPKQPEVTAPDLTVVDAAPAAGAAAFFADAEAVPAQTPPAADSISAKLQRIRAVVSHSDETPVAFSDEEDGDYIAPAKPQIDAISAAFASGALAPEDLDEPADTGETVADPMPEPAIVPDTVMADDMQVDSDDLKTDVLFDETDDAAETDIDVDDVLNILNIAAEDDEPAEDENATDGVLTAADEDDLMQEISQVEAELSGASERKHPETTEIDQDVSRLMDKAGARMDDPATTDKRDTYSHLRTAVAATEAARAEDKDAQHGAADQDYRGDLASVISPRRPEIQVTSLRPESDSAAPLKLVAEQRVDTNDGETGPVMPRRVTTPQDDSAPEEEGGFAVFAQEQGAQSLPDLLEAAAAYLSFIEGQEQFSRPQLMNKVRSLKQEAFNREESLRSFGQLLRDGKIEKAGGGRFAASNQIGFRPDDKRAAG